MRAQEDDRKEVMGSGELFYWTLNMSITGTLVGLIVVLIRKVRRLRRGVVMLLWLFPYLRFCIPIGFGSRFSLMTLVSGLFKRSVAVMVEGESGIGQIPVYAMNHIALVTDYSPFVLKTETLERVFFLSAVIWLAVAAAGMLFVGFSYFSVMRSVRRALPVGNGIYKSDEVLSPMLFGIVRPRIIIPSGMADEDNELVVLHERIHAEGFDNLWRMLVLVISVIHWFNPFVWICLRLFFEDMEHACDERVLSVIGEERRREYALTLVERAGGGSIISSTFGGAGIRSRVTRILSYRRVTVFSALFLVVLTVVLGYVFMMNAV